MKKIYWLFLPLFLLQCNKNPITFHEELGIGVLQGYVINWETKDTVGNGIMEVYEHNGAPNYHDIENFTYLTQGKIDEHGFFKIPFVAKHNTFYGLRPIQENHVISNNLLAHTVYPNETVNTEVHTSTYSWFTLNFYDTPELDFDSVYFYDEGLKFFPGDDTSFTIAYDRKFNEYYVWDKFSNGIATRDYFIGYSCASLDTCSIEIPF